MISKVYAGKYSRVVDIDPSKGESQKGQTDFGPNEQKLSAFDISASHQRMEIVTTQVICV